MQKAIAIYREYPRPFWMLAFATFVDHIGGFLLFPFFALYLTSRFGVSMAEVGVLFAVYSGASMVGSALGGGLADRFGRKKIMLFGMVFSALSALSMGLVNDFRAFFLLAISVGVLSDMAGPAHQAMVADLLPESKRADGYGIIRVAFNISAVIGPAIGGMLAAKSYLYLFIADAVISLLTAVFVAVVLPETKPQRQASRDERGTAESRAGYGPVFRDAAFLLFIGAFVLQNFAYANMNSTLGVFLRDVRGATTQTYGLLLSLNAILVVLFQFPVTRRIQSLPPMLMMAAGSLFYAIGFGTFGFARAVWLFIMATIVITIGEMITAPVAQAVVATLAPEDMRGRYMAVSGLAWGIPFAAGPYLAGLILDGPRPELLWYAAGMAAMIAAAGFMGLRRQGRLAARAIAAER